MGHKEKQYLATIRELSLALDASKKSLFEVETEILSMKENHSSQNEHKLLL